MKFLSDPTVIRAADFISSIESRDGIIEGLLELYSYKMTTEEKIKIKEMDKRLLALRAEDRRGLWLTDKVSTTSGHQLNADKMVFGGRNDSFKEIMDEIGKDFIGTRGTGPTGGGYYLNEDSRKTIIRLILTLNIVCPNFDFTKVNPELFESIDYWDAMNLWTSALELDGVNIQLITRIIKTIEDTVDVRSCNVFSLVKDPDINPFASDTVWSETLMFDDRKNLRVLVFSLRKKMECCQDSFAYGSQALQSHFSDSEAMDNSYSDVLKEIGLK